MCIRDSSYAPRRPAKTTATSPPASRSSSNGTASGGDVAVVFAGRRGAYEGPLRLLTGRIHRTLLARLTGLPPDAGAFLALDATARRIVLAASAPSLVAAIGAARLRAASVPVAREAREHGRSAWTVRARVRQSSRTLAWAARHR